MNPNLLQPPNGKEIAYTHMHALCSLLDDLSVQGLDIWQDEAHQWFWRWQATDLIATRGFWAMGEALLDAVVTRYPDIYDIQPPNQLASLS